MMFRHEFKVARCQNMYWQVFKNFNFTQKFEEVNNYF